MPRVDAIHLLNAGAVGDGRTDDTRAVQNAIQQAIAQRVPLYVPAGVYLIQSGQIVVTIPAGASLVIRGEGRLSVFKRKDRSVTSNFQNLFYFRTPSAGTGYAEELQITDVAFDSNGRGNPLPSGTTDPFLWQHCSTVRVQGTEQVRIRNVVMKNLTAWDPVADHLYFSGSTDSFVDHATIQNFHAYDRRRERSDITITAGLRSMNIDQIRVPKLEVELNQEYAGERPFVLNVSNAVIEQQLDIMGRLYTPSIVLNMSNSVVNDYFIGEISNSRISTTVLRRAANTTSNNGRIVRATNLVFDNCDFFLPVNDDGSVTPIRPAYDSDIVFRNSRFHLDSDTAVSANGHPLETTPYYKGTNSIRLQVIHCEFDPRFARSLRLDRSTGTAAATRLVDNVYAGGSEAIWMYGTPEQPLHVVIEGGDFSRVKGNMLHFGGAADGIHLEMNLQVPIERSGFTSSSSNNQPALIRNNRLLYTNRPPAGGALRGDTARLTVPISGHPYEWVAVNTHPTAANWVPSSTLAF